MTWEYKTVNVDMKGMLSTNIDTDLLQTDLNNYGREGWELVNFEFNSGHLPSSVGAIMILKRPK